MNYQDLKEVALLWDAKFITVPYHDPKDYGMAARLINTWHEDKMVRCDMTERMIRTCIDDVIAIDKGLIKSLHWMLFKGEEGAGDFRRHNVKLSTGYIPPDGIFINELMDSLLADTSLSMYEFYKIFECIHPFHDGNGRVGGILLVYMSSITSGKRNLVIPFQ